MNNVYELPNGSNVVLSKILWISFIEQIGDNQFQFKIYIGPDMFSFLEADYKTDKEAQKDLKKLIKAINEE